MASGAQRASQLPQCWRALGRRAQTELQVRDILEADVHVKREGIDVHPEIMVPLAGHVNELKYVKEIVDRIAEEVFTENGMTVDFKYGSMVEVPRAALTAEIGRASCRERV